MSARKVLPADSEGEIRTVLRAIQEKIDSIGSKIDQGATIVGRLEAKLGQS